MRVSRLIQRVSAGTRQHALGSFAPDHAKGPRGAGRCHDAMTPSHLLQGGPSADQARRCRITSTPLRAGAVGNPGQSMLASVVFGG